MGKRRTSTPSAREYIKEWRRDASTDRGASWGDKDAANRRIRAEVADDRQVILPQLQSQIKSMESGEAEAKLHNLLASTRKLEKGDPEELEAADPRVRLYAFIKFRLSRDQRRQLLEHWTRGVHEQKPSTSD